MNELLWHYQGRIVRVVDGDTVIVELDTGFHSTRWEAVRVPGVDCPEMVGKTKAAGQAAKAFVDTWVVDANTDWPFLAFLRPGWPFIITTKQTDSFGRYLATIVRRSDGQSLADAIIAAGHGVPA